MPKLTLVSKQPAARSRPGRRLRVAVATQDGKTANAHFGSAKRFHIYDVTAEGSRLVSAASFDDVSDESGEHGSESGDRIAAKIAALSGTQLLFVLAIGGPVAARVVRAKIHPIKLATPEPISAVLDRARSMLAGDPPPWLRRVFASTEERSMKFLDEEE